MVHVKGGAVIFSAIVDWVVVGSVIAYWMSVVGLRS